MPKYNYPGYFPTSHPFMEDRPNSKGKRHGGTDTPAKAGTPVYSEYNGKVFRSGEIYGYGKAVVVEFQAADGSTHRALYGHLGPDPLPQPEEPVYAGQQIPGAFVGSEKYVNSFPGAKIRGSHLHREIIHGKAPISADDEHFGINSSNIRWRADPDTFDINNPVFPYMRGAAPIPSGKVPLPRPRPNIPESSPAQSAAAPEAPSNAPRDNDWLPRLLNPKPLTPDVSRLNAWPQPPYPAGRFFPQTSSGIVNDRFYAPAPLPPQSAPPTPPPSPSLNAPHWLDPYAPRLDWLPPAPRGANGSDTSRPAAGSSAGDWLELQRSEFGGFKNLPQGNLGKRSDLAPDIRDRSYTPATNPLVSMGLLRSLPGGNQVPLPAQAATAPASWSPPLSPLTESDTPHWLAPYVGPMDRASPPLLQPQSDVPPWLDPEALGNGLRRLLGFPE